MPISTTLIDTTGQTWDFAGVSPASSRLTGTGQGIGDGSIDAFDGGLVLAVSADPNSTGGTRIDSNIVTQSLNGREINLAPMVVSGVAVTRSFLVSDAAISALGFVRVLDSFTNTTNDTITLSVQLVSNSGNDTNTGLSRDTDGSLTLTAEDYGYILDERSAQSSGDSAVGFVYGDGSGLAPVRAGLALFPGDGIDIATVQYNLTLQPGETQRLLSYSFQTATTADANVVFANFDDSLSLLNERGLLFGLSEAERAQIVNYSEGSLTSGERLTDGTGQVWVINPVTGSVASAGNGALSGTQLSLSSAFALFDTPTVVRSENGREVTVVQRSSSSELIGASVSHSLMASPDEGFARYLVTIQSGETSALNFTGTSIGLVAVAAAGSVVGAREIETGAFAPTVSIATSGGVLDDSSDGSSGTRDALSIVWGDFSLGGPVLGGDFVEVIGRAQLRALNDGVSLAANTSLSFLYFFASDNDAGMGYSDVARLSTPDFRALAGLSAAEVASIANFTLDETDRLQSVVLGSGADTYRGTYWGESISGLDGADFLFGGGSDDLLLGGAGMDTLDGGDGADTLNGGNGDDLYSVASVTDVVIEAANAGRDTVQTTVSLTLADNVENLVLLGTEAVDGEGNSLDNVLTGNGLDNQLQGDVGRDTLIGQNGQDRLFGGADADSLDGGNGDDELTGGQGIDTMVGGLGDDNYSVSDTGDVLVELEGGGTDVVVSVVSFSLDTSAGTRQIENLTMIGGSNLVGTGNGLANILTGNVASDLLSGLDGNDTLDGSTGNDTLLGGFGFDTLIGGIGDDSLVGGGQADALSGGEGNDQLLGEQGFDVVSGNAGNDSLFGGTEEDWMFGGIDNDRVEGGDGNDFIFGGLGFDSLFGDLGNDRLTGENNADQLFGGDGNDTLNGDQGVDLLNGGSGTDQLFGGTENDTLIGGNSNDTLSGGLGADRFEFAAGQGIDRITDFSTGTAGEVIALIGFSGLRSFAQVQAAMTIAAGTTTIALGGGHSIVVQGVAAWAADDFIFL